MPTRHGAIIKELGGYVALARTLKLPEETVRSWNKPARGIPPRYWHRVADLAGLTAEHLRRTSPRPSPRRRPS